MITMRITSPYFQHNTPMPARYSMRGGNASPALQFNDVPDAATSLILVCHDPDAPVTNGFTHWVMWNIPAETKDIAESMIPSSALEGINDWGMTGWGGPQPPSGTHRYVFSLYALTHNPDIPKDVNRQQLLDLVLPHCISQADLIGLYSALPQSDSSQ